MHLILKLAFQNCTRDQSRQLPRAIPPCVQSPVERGYSRNEIGSDSTSEWKLVCWSIVWMRISRRSCFLSHLLSWRGLHLKCTLSKRSSLHQEDLASSILLVCDLTRKRIITSWPQNTELQVPLSVVWRLPFFQVRKRCFSYTENYFWRLLLETTEKRFSGSGECLHFFRKKHSQKNFRAARGQFH